MKAVVILAIVSVLVVAALIVLSRRLARPSARTAPTPHAAFDGGARYASADERMRVELDGPSGAGEGILMALTDALRARGVTTHPIEPEAYGFLTVVEIDGEDVILEIVAGGEQEWQLSVKAPSGKVPLQVMDALRSLGDLRNVTWTI